MQHERGASRVRHGRIQEAVDDDMDGKAGVTVDYVTAGGYDEPLTAGIIFAPRADRPYVASRVAFSLGGSLESCTRASGSATVNRIDTRIFGCKLSGSSSDCNGSQASFLDQNCVNYTFGSASYTLLKVADGASCAAVRAALP
jgi:fructose-1,6-bisphosphatase/inositol monophosphatase family enzyme